MTLPVMEVPVWSMYKILRRKSRSRFLGVTWCNYRRCYKVLLFTSGKVVKNIGMYRDEWDAAAVYNIKVREYHGKGKVVNVA